MTTSLSLRVSACPGRLRTDGPAPRACHRASRRRRIAPKARSVPGNVFLSYPDPIPSLPTRRRACSVTPNPTRMPNDEQKTGRAGPNPAAADRADPLHILIQHADAPDFYDDPERSAKNVVRELMDLWAALNEAIDEQDEDTRNAISDAYRLHPLYAMYFPDDHAAALAEAEGGSL